MSKRRLHQFPGLTYDWCMWGFSLVTYNVARSAVGLNTSEVADQSSAMISIELLPLDLNVAASRDSSSIASLESSG